MLLEGGQHIRVEKYAMLGYGHMKKHTIPIQNVKNTYAYGGKTWYNPFRMGKGYYALKY